jgi:cytoskeletal protein RodZ
MSEYAFTGETLRERRVALGFSQADIYRLIHIPCNYTQALETGNLTNLPGPTYARGFLKTYCEFLELDPEFFEDQLLTSLKKTPAPTGTWAPTTNDQTTKPSWKSEFATWGAICAILLLGWLTYSAMIEPWANEAEKRVDAGVEIYTPDTNTQNNF